MALRASCSPIIRTISSRRSLRREPTQILRQLQHPGAHRNLVGVAREVEVPGTRGIVARDAIERIRDRRRLPLRVAERCRVSFDALQEHANFRRLAPQQTMDEVHLLRRGQPVVGELADVLPMRGQRIRIAQPARNDHRVAGEAAEQACARAAGSDFPDRPIGKWRCNSEAAVGPSGATDEKP